MTSIAKKSAITGSVTQGDTPGFEQVNEVTAAPGGLWKFGQMSRALIMQITRRHHHLSPHLINEARFGFTYQGNFFNDDLSLGQRAILHNLASNSQKLMRFRAYSSTRTTRTPGFSQKVSQFIYKENVFDPSDVVTLHQRASCHALWWRGGNLSQ